MAIARNDLGTALSLSGDEKAAVIELQRAVDLGFAPAHANLAGALFSEGHVDEAIHEYRKALIFDPTSIGVHSNLGTALAAKGDIDGAIAEFKAGIHYVPNDPWLHLNLGIAFETKGEIESAISEYKTALNLNPDLDQARDYLNRLQTNR